MGSTGLVILLLALSIFLFVGMFATGNLLDSAKADNNTSQAATGAGSTMGALWSALSWGIIIIVLYSLITAFRGM